LSGTELLEFETAGDFVGSGDFSNTMTAQWDKNLNGGAGQTRIGLCGDFFVITQSAI